MSYTTDVLNFQIYYLFSMFKSNKYLGGDNLLSKLKKQTRSQDLVCFYFV